MRHKQLKSINDMINYFKTIDTHSNNGDKRDNGLESLRKFIKNNRRDFYYLDSGKFYDVWCTMKLSEPYVIKVVKEVWASMKYRNYNQRFPRKNTKIAKHFLYPVWHSSCHSIIVQPKANTEIQAVNDAEDFFCEENMIYSDLHEGNVGMFEGRPVIIDYLHE